MPETILIVEDAEDDAFFIKRAFRATGLVGQVCHVEDGKKALDYLSGANHYSDRSKFPIPRLILLDIKLPMVSGLEVLRWLRKESTYPRLPVVMFTSSNQKADVAQAYDLGANAYVVKPVSMEVLADFASLVNRFWIEINVPFPDH